MESHESIIDTDDACGDKEIEDGSMEAMYPHECPKNTQINDSPYHGHCQSVIYGILAIVRPINIEATRQYKEEHPKFHSDTMACHRLFHQGSHTISVLGLLFI